MSLKKKRQTVLLLSLLATIIGTLASHGPVVAAKPSYHDAFVDNRRVVIDFIDVAKHVRQESQARFYQVVYPIGWASLGVSQPQCNPCDQLDTTADGIDFTDFHDNVLDSIPSGAGTYNPLRHVFMVVPAYSFITGGNPANDAAVTAAYASHIPTMSEAAVNSLLDDTLPDGSPVAIEIDTALYLHCSIVNLRYQFP